MKALYAEFTARPEAADRVSALMLDLTEAVRAEPGCVTFDPFVLPKSTSTYAEPAGRISA